MILLTDFSHLDYFGYRKMNNIYIYFLFREHKRAIIRTKI